MKKTQTYAVVDTVIGSVIGTDLTAEEARECIFLNSLVCTNLVCTNDRYETYEETPDLVKYLYDLAATIYSDGAEAHGCGDKQGAEQCHEAAKSYLSIGVELEEIYDHEAKQQVMIEGMLETFNLLDPLAPMPSGVNYYNP